MKIFDVLDTTTPDVVLGNHGCWIPGRQVKIPFQFGGRVKKYSRYGEADGPLETIIDEVMIMRALAERQMAPPVGEMVFFKEVISNHVGTWHCDPCGAYGYEIADATKLPSGKFNLDEMERLPISGSPGAWGDVVKPDNIVNGYLVDVRRSQQDLLKWRGPREPLLLAVDDVDDLRARVHRECQFPAGEREQAYQDFWIRGNLERGQRRVAERAEKMGFLPRAGDSVLDIGTQSGGFLQYAHMQAGPGRYVGVDVDANYISCAKALARSCRQNICFRNIDVVKERDAFVEWVCAYFPDGVMHLLTLSLEKHLGEDFLFKLIDDIGARHTYVETNAVGKSDAVSEDAPMKLQSYVKQRGGTYVGDTRDRSLRRLYRISR